MSVFKVCKHLQFGNMEIIHQILPTNILHPLGWAVIHSLWQSFAVALLLAAYLLAWQKTDARKRYIAGNIALTSILLLSVATFVYYLRKNQTGEVLGGEVWSDDGILLGHIAFEDNSSFFGQYFSDHMPLIVTVWGLGMVFFMLKMLGGLLFVQQLKTRMTQPLPESWQQHAFGLCTSLGIQRPVQLLESALAKTPMALGWLKPVVLLPIGALNQLSPAQVEAILAHELAHIARHDYLLNLLQSCVEILFYFNPAVWWVSAQVRTERENCCDDIAVRLCGNSLVYAKTLVSLQEMQLASPALAMSFSSNKKQLLLRIKRILQPSQNKSNVMEKLSATLLLSVAVVLLSVQADTPFGNMISKVAARALPMVDANAPVVEAAYWPELDTIPGEKRDAHIHYNDDDEEIEFKMKDDEITFLKIDGKVIPAEQYGEYEDRVRELLADIPEPPEAPEAPEMPDFPEMMEMPAPPAPPAFHEFPVAPAPPAPPARTRKIITQKDRSGTTFIIESGDGSDPVEIKVGDGKKGSIIVNGQEIAGMKKGDKTIILQDVPGGFNWNNEEFNAMLADQMHFDFSDMPRFSEDEFAFAMPDWNNAEFKALQEKLQSGQFNQDAMREYARQMEELRHSDEWQAKMEEEMARLSEDRARLLEDQQIKMEELQQTIELARERAMEEARTSQERAKQQMERDRQQMEKKRRSGSM